MTRCIEATGLVLALALAGCASTGASRAVATTRIAPPAVVAPSTVAMAPAPQVTATPTRAELQPRFQEALRLLKAGELDAARDAFLQLNKDYPQASGPLTDLGIIYARSRQPDQAIASFAKAAALNPRNVVALNWLGTLCRERGDFARAENAYVGALAADPGYAPARLNLAILYDVSLRRPQQALAQYREYLRQAEQPNRMVAVWIKELEASPGGSAVASAGAAP